MDSKKQLKLDIITAYHQKKISIDDVAAGLGVSKRSVLRYHSSFLKLGAKFVFHGNMGKAPTNKTSVVEVKKATQLMREKYFDFNMTHALEKLSLDEGIKINRETFREVCHSIGLVKKSKKRRSKVRKLRDRIPQEGVMLQMDGSPHRWFGGVESCLIGAIDDATSEVFGLEFFESESTMSCMKVLKNIIQKKGIFRYLYVDRAGIYGGPKRAMFSQVKRALRELGIVVIFANSAEAKGRIERLWGTLQDRLIPEMRLKKIKNYDEANDFVTNYYLQNEHNKKYKVLPQNIIPAWKTVPSSITLDEVFCIKELRTVKGDHSYSWNGKIYKITSEFKYSIQNQKIEVRTYLDGTWKVYFADREIEVSQHHAQPLVKLVENTEIILGKNETYKVRKDSHIECEGFYYSVDPKYIGEPVSVRENQGIILIFHRTKLIENHKKLSKGFVKASTKSNHMGPWEAAVRKGSMYRRAAAEIGPNCEKLVFILLQRGQGVIDNRSIWGIINLKKEYARNWIEEACEIAFGMSQCDYRTVCSVLRLRFRKRVISE